jgi:ATP-dependent DNA helicase
MSNPGTPVTPTFSNAARQDSQASSPLTDADQDVKMTNDGANGAQVADEEDMDVKAKALMHLLNTSEVCNPANRLIFGVGVYVANFFVATRCLSR